MFRYRHKCWWRDDVERRLDDAWSIKWSFPEVLSNHDIIRLALEAQAPTLASQRTQAVRTAIRDQFEKEKDVRFKQVDLRNNLFDLFIDVPIRIPELSERERDDVRRSRVLALYDVARRSADERDFFEPRLGAPAYS